MAHLLAKDPGQNDCRYFRSHGEDLRLPKHERQQPAKRRGDNFERENYGKGESHAGVEDVDELIGVRELSLEGQ